MKSVQVLAFDLGSSNGRAIIGEYKNGKIKLHEIHRFSNDPVRLNRYTHWDFLRLFHELETSLIIAKNKGYNIQSVGIDTWGVDYGLIDEDGELMGLPIQYRDPRAGEGRTKLLEKFDKDELKRRTGMDCVTYNTINQLMSEKLLKYDTIKGLLTMPDLFNYFLTGKMGAEFSMATTTQLYDYKEQRWNYKLMEEINLNKNIFVDIIKSGTVVGDIKETIINDLKIKPMKVVSVTSHDTAAAIRSIPSDDEDFLFIATGTWVIVGTNQKHMTMNETVMKYDLTNEGGKYPNVNLLKNHVGLWIIQESKRYWEKEGKSIGFGEMVKQAREVEIDTFIDILDERFFSAGHMPEKIKDYCRETNQIVPVTIGEVVRVIEQSLARQIAETLSHIEEAVDKKYEQVYIFGGGVQDALLCELIEYYSKKLVIIGPKEATAFGNVVDQFIALNVFEEKDRKNILKNSI